MVVKITNTRLHDINLFYRVPGTAERRPVISIWLRGRTMLQDVVFTNEEHYNTFVTQNQDFIDREIIIIGSTTASKAEQINEKNAKAESKEVNDKKNKTIKTLEDSVTTDKTKLQVKVEKDS